jgi:hypothetical protein
MGQTLTRGLAELERVAHLPREQACHCFLGIRRRGRSPRFSLLANFRVADNPLTIEGIACFPERPLRLDGL